jgi:hypothetical protein
MILYVVMYMAEQAHYDEIVYCKSYKPYYIYIMNLQNYKRVDCRAVFPLEHGFPDFHSHGPPLVIKALNLITVIFLVLTLSVAMTPYGVIKNRF